MKVSWSFERLTDRTDEAAGTSGFYFLDSHAADRAGLSLPVSYKDIIN